MRTKTKEGYTLIEVLMAIGFSLSLLLTVHYIPLRMTESFKGYTSEVATNRDSYQLASSIHKDLKKNTTIQETDDGFEIGEAVYVFSEEGVHRTAGNSTLRVAKDALTVAFEDVLVRIESADAETKKDLKQTTVDLVFPVENLPERNGGGI